MDNKSDEYVRGLVRRGLQCQEKGEFGAALFYLQEGVALNDHPAYAAILAAVLNRQGEAMLLEDGEAARIRFSTAVVYAKLAAEEWPAKANYSFQLHRAYKGLARAELVRYKNFVEMHPDLIASQKDYHREDTRQYLIDIDKELGVPSENGL